MAYDDEEVKQLRREEEARGKRPPIPQEIYKERLKKLKDFRKALETGDWELFKKQLIASGVTEGSEKWKEALQIWNQYHGPRYRE